MKNISTPVKDIFYSYSLDDQPYPRTLASVVLRNSLYPPLMGRAVIIETEE